MPSSGTSENPSTAARFDIRSIPTLLVLERGREIDRIVGVQTKADIARRIARVIPRRLARRLVRP
jgi:thioredoxin-like negative regulator of GroEL